ncbi:hypothetical protein BBJ29_001423 [Phytophthora kernoviae]|uniref:Uncharacterized protein n=1 Tax=Phytophthora kernoviae TaxID=325452 RepID=A0A3F2RTT3_9STRA|nr:hypothetical protein BBJ29_001423 [Phytophthora kernoviae]RLN64107.1 hypothetical protein BBP00_00003670 [Phytophthora kernoviae]
MPIKSSSGTSEGLKSATLSSAGTPVRLNKEVWLFYKCTMLNAFKKDGIVLIKKLDKSAPPVQKAAFKKKQALAKILIQGSLSMSLAKHGLKHHQQDPYGYNDGSLDGFGRYVGYGDRGSQDGVDDYSDNDGNDGHDDHGYHHSQGYGANGRDTPNHD